MEYVVKPASDQWPRAKLFNSLGHGAGMHWRGHHAITASSITVGIQRLQLPDQIERTVAGQMGVLDHWNDVHVGYYVELKNATCADFTMAKTLFAYKTFLEDTPPAVIRKSYPIKPVEGTRQPSEHVAGEWHGLYEAGGKREVGKSLSCASYKKAIRFQEPLLIFAEKRARSRIEDCLVDGRLSFLKHYGESPFAISYVTSKLTSKSGMVGTWHFAREQGNWEATWKSDFTGSVDDLSTTVPK